MNEFVGRQLEPEKLGQNQVVFSRGRAEALGVVTRALQALVLSLLVAGSARATIPEFCGDTVRGYAHHNCGEPDKDNDGFASDVDDDDTNMFIGSDDFATCAAAVTGTGRVIYIDGTSGNDATGTGATGAPYKSFANVGYYASGAPATHEISRGGGDELDPGDVLCLRGTIVDCYDPGADGNVLFRARNSGTSAIQGSSGNPVTIMDDPETAGRAVLNPSASDCTPIWINQADFINVDGIDITGTDGTTNKMSVFVTDGSDDVNFTRLYIHDVSSSSGSNDSGFTVDAQATVGCTRTTIKRTVIWDAYDHDAAATTTTGNGSIARVFRGADQEFAYNVFGYTATPGVSSAGHGEGFAWKHGTRPSLAGTDSEFHHNVLVNMVVYGFLTDQPKTKAYNNRILEFSGGGMAVRNLAGQSYFSDLEFYNNTVVTSIVTADSCLEFKPEKSYNLDGTTASDMCSGDDTISLNFHHNVCQIDRDTCTGGCGVYSIWGGSQGPDLLYTATTNGITANNNTLFNAGSGGVPFPVFQDNDTLTTCSIGNTGNSGTIYANLTDWRAAFGEDANSDITDPALDSDHVCTVAACSGRGWADLAVPSTAVSGLTRAKQFISRFRGFR